MRHEERGGRKRVAVLALCVLYAALLTGACAKSQAKAAPEGPSLAVPPPPPRVLAPVEEPIADNPPTPEPVAAPPRPTARPAPAAPPRRPPTTTPTEPEPKPAEPAAQAPPPTEVPARPAPTQADAAAERKVRDVMRKAAADLGRVNYQRLSADGRAQYELAKRFNDQAEQALKDRNYAFASTVADKAAALATELLAARP